MKKTLLFILIPILSGSTLWGQNTRLCLVEAYTQASCTPCAQTDPGFKSLMETNATKAIGICYHVSWPGVDPMNAQDSADTNVRSSYYGITGLPSEMMDGTISSVSQSSIDKEYAVAPVFSVALNDWYNSTGDSLYISCTVTATAPYMASGSLKLHIALLEKNITFATAPGSNGETEFYNVVRKMYPDASGTSLTDGNWTTGQTQTINLKGKLPAYIYKPSELAIVAFVQSEGNKKIQQAAYKASITGIQNIVAASSISVFPNPNNGIFHASFVASRPDNYLITLTNTLGQIVYQEKLSDVSGSYSKEINVAAYGKGVYLLVISNTNTKAIRKVITY